MFLRVLITAALAMSLAACGGDESPNSEAAGFYSGRTSAGQDFGAFIFEDGSYYVAYFNDDSTVGGFIMGSGSSGSGSFSSTDARDYIGNSPTVYRATISASYQERRTLGGSVNYSTIERSVSFSGQYQSDYELRPSLSSVAGSYQGPVSTAGLITYITMVVSPAGVVSGRDGTGCAISGSLSPKPVGNAFDIQLAFGELCQFRNTSMKGVALYDSGSLVILGASPDRSRATIYSGERLN